MLVSGRVSSSKTSDSNSGKVRLSTSDCDSFAWGRFWVWKNDIVVYPPGPNLAGLLELQLSPNTKYIHLPAVDFQSSYVGFSQGFW